MYSNCWTIYRCSTLPSLSCNFSKRTLCKTRYSYLGCQFSANIPSAIDSFAFQTTRKVIWTLTFPFSLAFLFFCNIKMLFISRRHRRQVQTQAQAVQQMAAENQQRFRGAGTVFYILLTLVACYVPAIATLIFKPFVNEDKRRILTLVKPWTSTFFVMYSGVSPFVYFFRCGRLRRYSKKLFRKASRLISCDNFV